MSKRHTLVKHFMMNKAKFDYKMVSESQNKLQALQEKKPVLKMSNRQINQTLRESRREGKKDYTNIFNTFFNEKHQRMFAQPEQNTQSSHQRLQSLELYSTRLQKNMDKIYDTQMDIMQQTYSRDNQSQENLMSAGYQTEQFINSQCLQQFKGTSVQLL